MYTINVGEGQSSPVLKDWWNVKNEEICKHTFALVNTISQFQSYRRTLNSRYARLYSNLGLLGFNASMYSKSATDNFTGNRVTYNVIKSVIDAAASKIAKNRPKPQFLTEDGNWYQFEKAKKLTQYIEGVYYDANTYHEAQRAFTDACVFGLGVIKIFEESGRIKTERVFPEEIVVDEAEAINGKPRQIHQVKYVSKDMLAAMFPKHKNEIFSSSHGLDSQVVSESVIDLVKVVESWHLPSSKESKDGRHVIAVEHATLLDEDYEKNYFPFVFFRWSERLAGFHGQGIAEELIGLQIEINKLLRNIQQAQHLVAVPRVYLEASSKVASQHINNNIGSVVKYSGKTPTFQTPQAMTAEVYNHLKWLIQSAYEVTGISQLSATSKKPVGLESAVALREYQDIESERFMLVGQRWDSMFMDLAKIVIDMSRDLYTENKDLSVQIKGKDFIKTIKWSEVDLPDDQFIMKVFPTSLLPSTPAARIQKAQEYIQAGWMDKSQALAYLDFPDIEQFETLEAASHRLTMKDIGTIMAKGEYVPPEPGMDLKLAEKLANQSYLKGRAENLPEERLELLLRYIDDIERLRKLMLPQEAMAPQAGPEAGLEQMIPQATPEAPPQSDLQPFAGEPVPPIA